MYKIRYTERNNSTASEYETKALLYLLSKREDSKSVDYIIIDCFNDLTGADHTFSNLWDIQSKGVSSLTPTLIGKHLITLFQNYLSEFDFTSYILVIPCLQERFFVHEIRDSFSINAFTTDGVVNINTALEKEYTRREKMIDPDIKRKIEDFLRIVEFVVCDLASYQYVKDLVNFKNKNIKPTELYLSIFHEIRDKQSSLKNIKTEGFELSRPIDVLQYNKHLERNKIYILVINRLVGIDVFSTNTLPLSYLDEISHLDQENRKDHILKCNSDICRTLFNKNNQDYFWRFLENITNLIVANPNLSVRNLYQLLDKSISESVFTLSEDATILFIALIKDGLQG